MDFIDLDHWDCFVGHEFEPSTNRLTLYWRDFRAGKSEGEKMVFHADLYSLHIHLQEIRIIRGKDLAVFLLKGHSITPNEAKKRFRTGTSQIEVTDDSVFSARVVRKDNDQLHVIDVHGAPLYTIAILPKGRHIRASASRRLLFRINIVSLIQRLQDAIRVFQAGQTDHDVICEKANTIRRILEQALKIELILRNVAVKKPYSQLLLGDLTGLLHQDHEPRLRQLLGKAALLANELSHDSGAVVEVQKAVELAAVVSAYLKILDLETSNEFVG